MINIKNVTLIGALTSKPYAFKARSWELKNVETIDLFESVCSNIKVDIRGSEIMRILPITNEVLNEEWISDKTRFAYDGLKRKRFINPMIKKNDLFIQSSWTNTFNYLKSIFNNNQFQNFILNTGNFNDLEQLTLAEKLLNKSKNIFLQNSKNNIDFQQDYTINRNLFKPIGKKIYIVVGCNLRLENPILNIKLKKLSEKDFILVGYIGPKYDSNINMIHLGSNLKILNDITQGKHQFSTLINNFLKKNNKNLKIKNTFKNDIELVFGSQFLQLKNSNKILNRLKTIKNKFVKFNINVLESYAGLINAKEIGLTQTKIFNSKVANIHYLLGSEVASNIKKNDFVIFQGTHNTKIRHKINVILPGFTWLEKSSLYLNCFGMVQKSQIVTNPPINARNDWKIIQILDLWYQTIKNKNNYFNNIDQVHIRLNELSPNLLNSISDYNKKLQNLNICFSKNYNINNYISSTSFKSYISNYYQTNSIDKSSKIMVESSQTINKKKNNFSKN